VEDVDEFEGEKNVQVDDDSCEDENGICKCVGESKCGGSGKSSHPTLAAAAAATTIRKNDTAINSRTNPSIVFPNDNSHTGHYDKVATTTTISTSTHEDSMKLIDDIKMSMRMSNTTYDDSIRKLHSMEMQLKEIGASDERSRKILDKMKMSLKNNKRQQTDSSITRRRLIGCVSVKDWCGKIALWGWIIIVVILLGKYMFGASKSQRVEHIAESIGGAQGVPGMPYYTANALRHMGKHSGWSDDQSFAEFDASHTDHLYETYKEFYDYHGMSHPDTYQGRRSR
jgi:hypothetical protein